MTYLVSKEFNKKDKYYVATFGGDYDYQVTAKTLKELDVKIKKELS